MNHTPHYCGSNTQRSQLLCSFHSITAVLVTQKKKNKQTNKQKAGVWLVTHGPLRGVTGVSSAALAAATVLRTAELSVAVHWTVISRDISREKVFIYNNRLCGGFVARLDGRKTAVRQIGCPYLTRTRSFEDRPPHGPCVTQLQCSLPNTPRYGSDSLV
jgi:hypothetical protein